MKPSILYVSYDGMLEPLGQSQVLAYLERLAADYSIHLISFEKKADWKRRDARMAIGARMEAAGIVWHPLRYHKRPSAAATAFDIAAGTAALIRIARRESIKVVHARSYVAAIMAMGAKRVIGGRLLFDIRGFWADERVDGGIWPHGGRMYRAAKAIERRLFLAADHVVTLTNASAVEIARFSCLEAKVPPVTVIPTCADLHLFSPRARPPGPFTLGHAGSVGTWYLFDETLAFFQALTERVTDAKLLVVNRTEEPFIRARAAAAGISQQRLEIRSSEHREMPKLISRMDAGAAIIKPAYSKIASAPTKLGEYLGCGIPCVGNVGVGDMASILEGERVGVALKGFSPSELRDGVERLLSLTRDPGLSDRCTATARRVFSLESGVAAYDMVWWRLLSS